MASVVGAHWESVYAESSTHIDLVTAASIGNVSVVCELLQQASHTEINSRNKSFWTPLMYAACSSVSSILELLLQCGADVNAANRQGQTAIALAAMYGNNDNIYLLLKIGANPEIRDFDGRTALFHAAAYGHTVVVQTLLDAGVNVNYIDKGGISPLAIACANKHDNIVALLFKMGAKIGTCGTGGRYDQLRSSLHEEMHAKEAGGSKQLADLAEKCRNITLRDTMLAVPQHGYPKIPKHEIHTLEQLFHYLGISKYLPVFEKEGIDLSQFLKLTESELERIGIRLVGPRMKMTRAIAYWNL